jgi:hypothetical protein
MAEFEWLFEIFKMPETVHSYIKVVMVLYHAIIDHLWQETFLKD